MCLIHRSCYSSGETLLLQVNGFLSGAFCGMLLPVLQQGEMDRNYAMDPYFQSHPSDRQHSRQSLNANSISVAHHLRHSKSCGNIVITQEIFTYMSAT